MTKIPIHVLIQEIGKHSLEDYEAYASKCELEYEAYRGNSNCSKRHRLTDKLEVTEQLCVLRGFLYYSDYLSQKGEV